MTTSAPSRIGLRIVALGYLAALLLVPIGVVLYRTFETPFLRLKRRFTRVPSRD